MNTPTYNQYCLQSLDASNTFQHSEALFQEDKARDKAINDFSDISNSTIVDKYLFYRGIKAKKLSGRASTNRASLVGLFAPTTDNPSITSEDLCFVYKYKTKKDIMTYVGKTINKTSSSFYIDGYINYSFSYKQKSYKKIDKDDNLIEIDGLVKDRLSYTTIVEVYLDPLLCLQSALCNDKLKDKEDQIYIFIKGRIFLNCLKYWSSNKQNYANGKIILNILSMCLTDNNNIKVLNPINVNKYNVRKDKESEISNLETLLSNLNEYYIDKKNKVTINDITVDMIQITNKIEKYFFDKEP